MPYVNPKNEIEHLKKENEALRANLERARESFNQLKEHLDDRGQVQSRLERMLADILERSLGYLTPASKGRERVEEVISVLRVCAQERKSMTCRHDWVHTSPDGRMECINCGKEES
jgi:chromosome segregation ATPase